MKLGTNRVKTSEVAPHNLSLPMGPASATVDRKNQGKISIKAYRKSFLHAIGGPKTNESVYGKNLMSIGETKNQLYNTDLNLNSCLDEMEEKPEKPAKVKKQPKEENKSRNKAL